MKAVDDRSSERRGPLEQLGRCHRRLEQACDALNVAASDHDLDAARDVAGFLSRQIGRHEQDEESSLFPRLLERASNDARRAIEQLGAEHRAHEALRERVEHLVSGDEQDAERWSQLASLADELARAYRSHIDLEERVVFPEARATLSPEALAEMAVEMDARRGR